MALSYTAPRVHSGHQWLPKGATVVVTPDGLILDVLDEPLADTTSLAGLLCPGFVNAHCHLELSHLNGMAPQKTGIADFLIFMSTRRQEFEHLPKEAAMTDALKELRQNGVVAVGDIANSTDVLFLREQEDVLFHSFIEALGMLPAMADKRFAFYRILYEQFAKQKGPHRQSITPHAPYSVSRELFGLIDAFAPQALLSIHNQEGPCENELFQTGEGDLNRLFGALGMAHFTFTQERKNSLPAYGEWLSNSHPLILVHNTFTCAEDIKAAAARFEKLWFCLCPNANLYIEGRLPDVNLLLENNAKLCIGTDSLASNHQLSVLAELQTLKNNFPKITWEELLKWGTANGADALQMSDRIGSFTPGKKPGLLHITGMEKEQPVIERIL